MPISPNDRKSIELRQRPLHSGSNPGKTRRDEFINMSLFSPEALKLQFVKFRLQNYDGLSRNRPQYLTDNEATATDTLVVNVPCEPIDVDRGTTHRFVDHNRDV